MMTLFTAPGFLDAGPSSGMILWNLVPESKIKTNQKKNTPIVFPFYFSKNDKDDPDLYFLIPGVISSKLERASGSLSKDFGVKIIS